MTTLSSQRALGRTPPRAGLTTEALEARVDHAQIDLLHERNQLPSAAGVVAAVGYVALYWRDFPHEWLLGWLGAKVLLALARYEVGRSYLRNRNLEGARRFERRFLAAAALDGLVWSALAVVFAPPSDPALAAMSVGLLIGVGAMGAVFLASHLRGNVAFMVGALLPGILRHLPEGNRVSLMTSGGLLAILVLSLVDGRRSARSTRELLRLRFQSDEVARQQAEALEAASRHDRARSLFLATMSHEMRTPLHGILGTVRLLRDEVTDPAQLERVRIVERSGDHLLGVINDVLDFSRLEAGGLRLKEAPWEVGALLREVAEMVAATAQEQGNRLLVEAALPAGAWALGDGDRVRQLLLNLLGNALKFTERGEVRLAAAVDGVELRFTVADTGPGIDPADLPHIFEPFRQGDGSFSRRFSGTGLGLAISRELAVAMGGSLECRSEPGKGATFTLAIPWHPCAAPAPIPAPAEQPPGALRGHVLLAEDNPVNVVVAQGALGRLGLTVEVAGDGAEAVRAFERRRPDLVLMDCHMPGMDGFDASRAIRAAERARGARRVPIVAVTASAAAEQLGRCQAAGMDDLLAKPFRPSELAAVLARHLGAPRR